MTRRHTLPPAQGAALDAVTDADREWFEAHPRRRFHLRHTEIAELMPGEAIAPGSRTLVVRSGDPGIRARIRVGKPPVALRQDTDNIGRLLIERLDAQGWRLNGLSITQAVAALAALVP